MCFVVTMPLNNVVEDEVEDAGHSTTVMMDTNKARILQTEAWTSKYVDGMAPRIGITWLLSCIVSLEYKYKIHTSRDSICIAPLPTRQHTRLSSMQVVYDSQGNLSKSLPRRIGARTPPPSKLDSQINIPK